MLLVLAEGPVWTAWHVDFAAEVGGVAFGEDAETCQIAARFDATAEITLDELRIELVYPLDDIAETFFP